MKQVRPRNVLCSLIIFGLPESNTAHVYHVVVNTLIGRQQHECRCTSPTECEIRITHGIISAEQLSLNSIFRNIFLRQTEHIMFSSFRGSSESSRSTIEGIGSEAGRAGESRRGEKESIDGTAETSTGREAQAG